MTSTDEASSFKSPIRHQLVDDESSGNNYPEWLIDIRAHLRKQKLWEYTQRGPDPEKSAAIQAKWLQSAMEAADVMTLTISGPVKKKLQANAFNDGFQMMIQLAGHFAPKGEAEFMRLTREYYTLRYEDFNSMTSYLTQIKTLEERIQNTGVVLDENKQTLLCLGMSLPERYQYFTKLWELTPGMTAEKARNMLLEEERRMKSNQTDINTLGAFAAVRSPDKRTPSRKAVEAAFGPCSKCGKAHSDATCWKLHPELAPEWLQEKWTIEKRSRKRKF